MGAVLFCSNLDDPEEWRPPMTRLMPDLELRVYPNFGKADDIDVAMVWRPPAEGLGQFKNLKAILSLGAGVDQLDLSKLPASVPVARLVDDVLTTAMAEYCLLAALRYHRRFDVYERNARLKKWEYHIPRPAAQRTVGVLGLGVLGAATAEKLKLNGFKVVGWSRAPKSIAGVESFAGPDGLHKMAAKAEIVVNLLPLTPETRGILNKKLFDAMPQGSYLINVGRGGHLTEDDLLPALQSGRLAGATLDVFQKEPLAAEHAFWNQPGILITPHVASTGGAETAAPQVVENIRRARAGKTLLNQVDKAKGY
ncbi:MAG: glyoxylate/hydroxypyruvate reductase A [Alphaproteobacteria bacterium]|nr:glyoxylate/hydroxypyruvate reductase A [Alphaproteobacteria bacterium]